MTHGGPENETAAGGIADEECFANSQGFQESLQMSDAQSGWILKAVNILCLSPAQNIRCNDMKFAGKGFNVVAPGDFS